LQETKARARAAEAKLATRKRRRSPMASARDVSEASKARDVRDRAGRVVGHDPIDSPGEEPRDVHRLVDRPDVDLDAEAVNGLDDGLRDHPPETLVLRHLKRHSRGAIAAHGPSAQAQQELPHLVFAEARPDRRRNRAEGREQLVLVRGHDHPVFRVMGSQDPREGLGDAGASLLDLDGDPHLGEGIQDLAQSGHPKPSAPIGKRAAVIHRELEAGVELSNLGEAHVLDPPSPAGRAGNGAVVNDHELGIRAEVNVELDVRGALLARETEGFESVLGSAGARSAVGEESRLGTGKKTVSQGHSLTYQPSGGDRVPAARRRGVYFLA